jgi:hypothetical protein
MITKEEILKTIEQDGTYDGDEDWWTGHTDKQGNVYDINVYIDDLSDKVKTCVTVYPCELRSHGHYETLFEDPIFGFTLGE